MLNVKMVNMYSRLRSEKELKKYKKKIIELHKQGRYFFTHCYKSDKIMSWKNIFNTGLKQTLWNGIEEPMQIAQQCGYKFFSWNGWIYKTDGTRTNILVEQCI
jgi:hypothetical protein